MRKIIPFVVAAMLLTACSSLDCPLNNIVSVRFDLRGAVDTLSDTLTVSAIRPQSVDTVLLNRSVNTTYFAVPMSYSQDADRLELAMIDTVTKTLTWDTVTVMKTNQPHFESVDCNPSVFHTITGVSHTSNAIDSIVINDPNVDNDETKTNLYIYFRPRN